MRRTDNISIRLLREEKAVILGIAEREKLSVSQALRHIIRESGRTVGLWPPPGQPRGSQASEGKQQ